MELLTNPKADYLLSASLESLHAESKTWLSEIDFWKDEMAFFYKLLTKKKLSVHFSSDKLAAIEKEIVRISNVELEKLKTEVREHEIMLAGLFKAKSLKEEGYREAHSKFLKRMQETLQVIRELKKEIFAFVEKSN
ncbi:hypothetical protein JMN32_20830 [Fulvivirga sp. 29W222]|uniref:Uncharacterized protein n=1 Tax=Fulvivirga marina TaxID=2494733 RepID=A0A937G2H2_9BACT|nr:hypothetical protein [Fulvivirga marina]MBL6448770.1 hypothetical protein [Fulvivirga marina]